MYKGTIACKRNSNPIIILNCISLCVESQSMWNLV